MFIWLVFLIVVGRSASSTSDLNIYTLAVGSGDATVIQCPTDRPYGNGDITIIDMGSSPTTSGVRGMRWKEFDFFINDHKNNVKAIMLTHPHSDHYNFITRYLDGGKTLKDHFPNLEVVVVGGDPTAYFPAHTTLGIDMSRVRGRSYDGDLSDGCGFKNTKTYTCIIEFKFKPVSNSIDLCTGAAKGKYNLEIIAANYGMRNHQTTNNPNGDSLVMKLTTYHPKSFLFMGDFEGKNNYKTLLDDTIGVGTKLKSDVMMIPHHGSMSNGNNSPELFNKVLPDNIIISANVNYAQFRHPRCGAVESYNRGQAGHHRVDCWHEQNIKTKWFKNVFATSSNSQIVTANYLRIIKTQMSNSITIDYYCTFNLRAGSTFTCKLPTVNRGGLNLTLLHFADWLYSAIQLLRNWASP